MLINPAVLLDALQSIGGIEEFQVVIDRSAPFSMDEMVVRVATAADRQAIASEVIDRAQAAVGVRPRVVFATANEIYDAGRQTKAQRFVDRRYHTQHIENK